MSQDRPINPSELLVREQERSVRKLPSLTAGAFRIAWRAARPELIASIALQVVTAVGLAGQVLITREVLVRLLAADANNDFGRIAPWLGALALASAAVLFANMLRAEQQRLLGELVARSTIDQILEVSTAVDLLAYDSSTFHNQLQRAMTNAGSRPTQMVNGLLNIVSGLLTIVAIGFALILIEPLLVLALVVAYIPLWIVTTRGSRINYRFSLQQTERDRRRQYLSFILMRRDEAAELRAFGVAPFLRERHDRLYDERIRDLRVAVRRRLKLALAGGLVSSILNAAALALLAWFVTSDRLSVADAGAAAAAIVLLAQRLRMFAGGSGSLYESALFIQDFTTFVDALPEIESARGSARPAGPFEHLEISGLSFTYPTKDDPALEDINLSIRRGEVIALVGENGSGKTTLAKLLAGLYAPTNGTIRWDGVDVSSFDPRALREWVGVIFQDYVKYVLSARENIGVGRISEIDDPERFHEAARRASADELIESLSDGPETLLGAMFYGGVDLSIGQWQRIAIARGFFRDAPFLILDEPTAALDPRSEAQLFDNMRTLYQGRTVLLISHRFSTVRNADRIFVLQQGRLVESGSHDALMRQGGLYAELFTLQAAGFVDGGRTATP